MSHRFLPRTIAIAAIFAASVAFGPAPAFAAGGHAVTSDPLTGHQAVRTSTGRVPQWSQSLARHRSSRHSPEWRQAVTAIRGTDRSSLLSRVNSTVNRARYVPDTQNWGRGDYWASPAELFARGGDCEDFAIAKYLLLQEMGISASRMRILVLRGGGQVEHAVLAVNTAQGVMILDNQRSGVYRLNADISRRTFYSISGGSLWVSLGAPRQVARQ